MKSNKHLYQMWENMRNGNYFIKGKIDSTTRRQVTAVKNGNNYFSPETCYLDYVENLPDGTYYVDGEPPSPAV